MDEAIRILEIIKNYQDKHILAKEIGSEYICQNDEAQIDAIEVIAEIFDYISRNNIDL